MLGLLLAHGADPNRPAFAGLSPHDVATVRGYDDTAALLRDAGGQPSTHVPFVAAPARPATTGIKAIDLWCPLPERGLVHLAPGYGLGAIVLLGELSRRAAISGQEVVWTGFVPVLLDLGDLRHAVAEGGIADHVTVSLAAPTAPDAEQTAALDAGMTLAEQARLAMTDELDVYLSQPFHVAEHVTGVPGETVEPDELHTEVSKRNRAAITQPRHLVIAHLSSIIQGAMYLGLSAAFALSKLTSWLETTAAVLLVSGSTLFVAGATLNWRQQIGDHFAVRSIGWRCFAASSVGHLVGIAVVLIGVVAGVRR